MGKNYILSSMGIGIIILLGIFFNKTVIVYTGGVVLLLFSIVQYLKYKECFNEKINDTRYRFVLENLEAISWRYISKTNEIIFDNHIIEMVGLENKYLVKDFLDIISDKDKVRVRLFINNIKENPTGKKQMIEFNIINNKEIEVPVRFIFNLNNKKILGGIMLDLTEKVNQEKKIRDTKKIYKLAIQGSRDILFYWDTTTDIITLKGRIYNIVSNYTEESLELSFNKFISYIYEEDRETLFNMKKKYVKEEYFDVEFRFKTDDRRLWFSLKGKKIKEGQDNYIYGSLSNINDRKEKEEKINFISYYDEITGLPNRRLFKERAEEILIDIKKEYRNLALIFIDLDSFKYINDTHGHEVGDKLLKTISIRIKEQLIENSIIARFEGDEFVIIIDRLESFDKLEEILNKIIEKCNISFKIEDKEIYCTVSIGVSMYGKDGVVYDDLMRSADLAMYTAKENGKNKYEFFNDNISKKIKREIEIKEGLRKAIIDRELYGVLQPKFSSKTKKVVGFEYLIRWKSEKLGIVPPGEFIQIAETTGQIIEIGKYIINDAICLCKKLSGFMSDDFKIAINLSEVQLRDMGIVDYIKDIILKNNVNPKNIEIEITESIIMKSAEKNINILRKLKEVGVTIALDDFGTGYSSLSYLRVLPIDILKIDKSFIDYINKDRKSEYIIETIIDLSHCFNFLVVAEGVETKDQFEYLKEKDCDIIQGYYFSKPIPFKEIETKINYDTYNIS